MNYYEVLDVPRAATPEQIKSAWRIQVHLHHPDRLQQATPTVRRYAEERLKLINEAYRVLSDPAERAAYDAGSGAPQTSRDYAPRARPEPRSTAETSERTRRAEAERRGQEAAAAKREEKRRRTHPLRSPGNIARLPLALGEKMAVVRIPAGEFWMGSDDDSRDAGANERPQHRLRLPEFWIGRYPVTNEEYHLFLMAHAEHRAPRRWERRLYPDGAAHHPVDDVNWYDALDFCRWLSQLTGRACALPTEAQWEKAARGTDGRLWPWGSVSPDAAHCNMASEATTPVGQFSPVGDSPYGCTDMLGNVWEWCSSLEKPYPYQPDDGREDLNANGARILRGGVLSNRGELRCAYRNYARPVHRNAMLGFRVAINP